MRYFNKTSALIIICCIFFSHSNVFAIEDKSNYIYPVKITKYLLDRFQSVLQKNRWQVMRSEKSLDAVFFYNNFSELRIAVESAVNGGFRNFSITIIKNKIRRKRILKFKEDEKVDKRYLMKSAMPFLLEAVASNENSPLEVKSFFPSFSIGYTRVHDSREFYPSYKKGSLYIMSKLIYDPSALAKIKRVKLSTGDYFLLDVNTDIGSHLEGPDRPLNLREFYFDFTILLYGNNFFLKKGNFKKRELYGVYSGLEFFKPGFGAKFLDTSIDPNAMTWDQSIFREQPHIQWVIYRAVQFGYSITVTDKYIYNASFNAGFGPSINSSMAIHNVSEDREDELSFIFKSTPDRKENYYNSFALPANAAFSIDGVFNFKFGINYFFYLFFPMERETAYDILNRVRLSAGYHLRKNLLLNAHYEYWHILSRVRDLQEKHFWNKIIIELKYLL